MQLGSQSRRIYSSKTPLQQLSITPDFPNFKDYNFRQCSEAMVVRLYSLKLRQPRDFRSCNQTLISLVPVVKTRRETSQVQLSDHQVTYLLSPGSPTASFHLESTPLFPRLRLLLTQPFKATLRTRHSTCSQTSRPTTATSIPANALRNHSPQITQTPNDSEFQIIG